MQAARPGPGEGVKFKKCFPGPPIPGSFKSGQEVEEKCKQGGGAAALLNWTVRSPAFPPKAAVPVFGEEAFENGTGLAWC